MGNANESEVVLSIGLEDNASPALAGVEANYTAALANLEAATMATSAALEAAWLAPVSALAQASQEAIGWLSALSGEFQALGSLSASPTITINDLATPTLRAIRAELAALGAQVSSQADSLSSDDGSGPTFGAAAQSITIDRKTVREVIFPELQRLSYRS
jgi:hypothetical protein